MNLQLISPRKFQNLLRIAHPCGITPHVQPTSRAVTAFQTTAKMLSRRGSSRSSVSFSTHRLAQVALPALQFSSKGTDMRAAEAQSLRSSDAQNGIAAQ
ncbi:MAG: hypothetical protein WKG07_38385 [Hymenobacter sp.]